MVRYVDDVRLATRAFEAAMWQECVQISCRCGHAVIVDPHALWWLCAQRQWNDRFKDLRAHFYCSFCVVTQRRRIRPVMIELVKGEVSLELPMPPEREWKRALRRVRS